MLGCAGGGLCTVWETAVTGRRNAGYDHSSECAAWHCNDGAWYTNRPTHSYSHADRR